eukprot:1769954-Prymnesium_polylepis.1
MDHFLARLARSEAATQQVLRLLGTRGCCHVPKPHSQICGHVTPGGRSQVMTPSVIANCWSTPTAIACPQRSWQA